MACNFSVLPCVEEGSKAPWSWQRISCQQDPGETTIKMSVPSCPLPGTAGTVPAGLDPPQFLPLALLGVWVRKQGLPGSPMACLGRDEGGERGDLHILGVNGIKPHSDAEGTLQGMGGTTSRHAPAQAGNLG